MALRPAFPNLERGDGSLLTTHKESVELGEHCLGDQVTWRSSDPAITLELRMRAAAVSIGDDPESGAYPDRRLNLRAEVVPAAGKTALTVINVDDEQQFPPTEATMDRYVSRFHEVASMTLQLYEQLSRSAQ